MGLFPMNVGGGSTTLEGFVTSGNTGLPAHIDMSVERSYNVQNVGDYIIAITPQTNGTPSDDFITATSGATKVAYYAGNNSSNNNGYRTSYIIFRATATTVVLKAGVYWNCELLGIKG